jgi:hypothetical protein
VSDTLRPSTPLPERFTVVRMGKSSLGGGEKGRGAQEPRTRVCACPLSVFSYGPVPRVTVDGTCATGGKVVWFSISPSRYRSSLFYSPGIGRKKVFPPLRFTGDFKPGLDD